MTIVVVVMHMLQVFLCGAYNKPRDATWMAGVGLLPMTLAYGPTGYLLFSEPTDWMNLSR